MSFLKNLFEKRKDLKYGKGHKLGEKTEAPAPPPQQPVLPRPQTSAQSDAARAAGEAALSRLEKKNTHVRPVASYKQQISKDQEKQEDEWQKALTLKQHYFGDRNIKNLEAAPLAAKYKILFTAPCFAPDEFYPKNEIEDKIEQKLLNQLDEEPILVATTLLFTANHKNKEKLEKCIELINKLVDNILQNPTEEKFRKIRLENPAFKEKVYSCKYADMVLKKSGFKATQVKKYEQDPNDSSIQIEITDDCFLYEDTNLEPLNRLKEALSLGEPIVPQLNRDRKVYKIVSSKSVLANFDLSEEFYNLNIEDMRREQALRNEALEKQGMLRTKAMRERDEQLELRRYNYCLIRIRFPNDYILQGLFKATETYEDLYKFVLASLEYEFLAFELFGHSLKKSTVASSTLAEAGLAPATLLNFRWNEDSVNDMGQTRVNLNNYIKKDLIERASNLE